MKREQFLISTEGGPHPGVRACREGDRYWTFLPDPSVRWPLPDELPDAGGQYVKISESDRGPQREGSTLVRGARYEWKPE